MRRGPEHLATFAGYFEVCTLDRPKASDYTPPTNSRATSAARARVAQLVEQAIENRCVTGSIPVSGTISFLPDELRAAGSNQHRILSFWLRAPAVIVNEAGEATSRGRLRSHVRRVERIPWMMLALA